MRIRGRVRGHDQTDVLIAAQLCQRRFDLRGAANRDSGNLNREPLRRSRRRFGQMPGARAVRVDQDGDPHETRGDLLEQLHKLCTDGRLQDSESGRIAAGLCEALNEAIGDRIASADEDNGYGPARLLHWPEGTPVGQNHVGCSLEQFRGGCSQPITVAQAPFVIDVKVAADCPAQLLEALPEHSGAAFADRIVLGI